MKKFNIINNKGITLVALAITIVILIMLAGITFKISKDIIKESDKSTLTSELEMVQHAVLERYTKATLTHENYPGIKLNSDSQEIKDMKALGIELKGLDTQYYKLTKDNGLDKLGIKGEDDEYIVNYITGEVFNLTQKKTSSGQLLYVYAREYEREYTTNGLILYLDAINNTGKGHSNTTDVWKDLSENGNDALLKNSPRWKEKSLHFDGIDDYATTQLNVENDFTIEFVAKNIDLTNAKKYGSAFMINSWDYNVDKPSLQIYLDARGSNKYLNSRYFVPKLSDTIQYMERQKSNITDLTNLYYTITKTNEKINIYINGKLQSEQTIDEKEFIDRFNLQEMNLEIGRWYSSSTNCVTEDVNSMRIYNRALTDEEILQNYEMDKEKYDI